jgi:hypothetical protein
VNAKRKELIAQYKEREITGGVYLLKNTRGGKSALNSTTDMRGSRNRFDFARRTGSCVDKRIQDDWTRFGPDSYEFEVLDEVTKGAERSMKEFEADVAALKELWSEKLSGGGANE